MPTLYYAPGACSIGIHIILEEIGKPYALATVNLREGGQFAPAYSSVNPKNKVPSLLRDDGSVLTEWPAIAWWLAATSPAAGLLPADPEGQARAIEAMDYVCATMHMQGFARYARPGNFTPDEAGQPAVQDRGKQIFARGFEVLEPMLAGRDWIAGRYSVADAALFFVEFWATKRLGFTLPPHIAAHFARMKARPAVQRTLEQEGLAA